MRIVCLILVLVGLVAIQLLLGGTRLLYAIPGYGAIAAAAILTVFSMRRFTSPPQQGAVISAIVFFLYIAVRAATSPVAYLAWPDLFLSLACLSVYLLFACHLTNPGLRLGWVALLAALALAGVLIGAQQFRDGGDWMPFGFLRPDGYRGRASGFFICPNHLAGFLEVTGLFALAVALWSRLSVIWRVFAGYVCLVCVAGIVLSGSRGGILSFASGLLVLAGLTFLRLRKVVRVSVLRPALIGAAVLVLLAGGAWVAVRQSSLLESRAKLLIDTSDIRRLLWAGALEQAKVSPVVGTGAGTYFYYGRKFRQPGVERDPVHVHNDYLELLAEYGLLGASLALVFVLLHFRAGLNGFRALCARGETHPRGLSNAVALNIGAVAALAAYVAHSFVDFNLHIPENALLLAGVGGILANPSVDTHTRSESSDRVRSRLLLPRIVLVAAGLLLALLTLPKLPGEWYAENARMAVGRKELLDALRLAQLGLDYEAGSPALYLYQARNPNLSFYQGEANWEQARNLKNPVVARSYAEAALQSYQNALKTFPQDSRSLLQTAWILARLGRFDEAGPVFDLAVAWDPRNGPIRTYQGHYLRMKGDRLAAAAAYRAALALGPDIEAANSLKEIEDPARR